VPEAGRPPVMTADKIKVARQLYKAKELTVEEFARTLGVGHTTICRHFAETGS
jgi:DNA-binding transcriptional regulator YiaG